MVCLRGAVEHVHTTHYVRKFQTFRQSGVCFHEIELISKNVQFRPFCIHMHQPSIYIMQFADNQPKSYKLTVWHAAIADEAAFRLHDYGWVEIIIYKYICNIKKM